MGNTITEYRTIDKTEWPDGPWKHEPDKLSWTDEETGLPCLVVRNPGGALCGYAGVGPDHPWHRKGYGECVVGDCDHEDWAYECTPGGAINVHGGLTYADPCQASRDQSVGICRVPAPGETDDVWWFGFDCAHHMDLVPKWDWSNDGHYRDVGYVRSEVRDLARQLAGVK